MTADMGWGESWNCSCWICSIPTPVPAAESRCPGRHTFVRPVRPNCWHIRQMHFVHSAESLSMTAFAAKDWRMTGRWH